MRVKKDYMGNDQLLPAYNLQMVVCDEYIVHYGVYPYASDMDCFQPLMEGFANAFFQKISRFALCKYLPFAHLL